MKKSFINFESNLIFRMGKVSKHPFRETNFSSSKIIFKNIDENHFTGKLIFLFKLFIFFYILIFKIIKNFKHSNKISFQKAASVFSFSN